MVLPRKWKVVSGGVTMAVALGAGTAIAHPDDLPTLKDAVSVTDLGVAASLLQVTGDPATVAEASPFVSIASESVASESVASESVPSVSVASVSVASASVASVSVASVSVASVSVAFIDD